MTATTKPAMLFPGQGAAATGARPLVEQRCPGLHDTAMSLLETDPFERAEESTRYAQPAIFLASLAGWQTVVEAGIEPLAFAGHSLGEITALTAAGVLAPEDGLSLVVLRGALMDELSRTTNGGMLAILKGTVEYAKQLAQTHELCVANYNAPGQTVLSGPMPGLQDAASDARANGLRALMLGVSGAFHTPAMRPARAGFQQALRKVKWKASCAPVLSAMSARPFTDPVNQLGAALIQPVRWTETMTALEQLGAASYLDVGPDRVLERLTVRNLGDVALIDRENLDGVCT